VLDVALDHAAMRAAETSLGCGAFYVMSNAGCPVEVVADAVSYLARQSSQQCGVCIKGTSAMAETLRGLSRRDVADVDLDPLARWSSTLSGRGNCALLDAVCSLVGSLLAEWDDDVRRHVAGAQCIPCSSRDDDFRTTRLAVDPAAVTVLEDRA
jgi:NADH:ubiquinone oxidoreductase subunit F (NADH-binding)